MAISHITFQYNDNQTKTSYEATVLKSLFCEQVEINDLQHSKIDIPEQKSCQCFDNVLRTMLRNSDSSKTLKLCLGLQQDLNDNAQIVEHCWLEVDGQQYDSSDERKNSRYFLFCSLTLGEIGSIMGSFDLEYTPNIVTLMALQNRFQSHPPGLLNLKIID